MELRGDRREQSTKVNYGQRKSTGLNESNVQINNSLERIEKKANPETKNIMLCNH